MLLKPLKESIPWCFYTWSLLPKAHFIDILTRFGTVSKVFPKGLKARDPCGVAFDWCSSSCSVWCVHRCGGDWVGYPCWSWSSELPACVLRSHSGFTVVSHHIFPPHYHLRGLCWYRSFGVMRGFTELFFHPGLVFLMMTLLEFRFLFKHFTGCQCIKWRSQSIL